LKKIEELNSSINELSKRINALEEIFKEILPALIDSVRSLSRLVKEK
jgi:vacuolar-type H+-ATPase subunit D/Vma8